MVVVGQRAAAASVRATTCGDRGDGEEEGVPLTRAHAGLMSPSAGGRSVLSLARVGNERVANGDLCDALLASRLATMARQTPRRRHANRFPDQPSRSPCPLPSHPAMACAAGRKKASRRPDKGERGKGQQQRGAHVITLGERTAHTAHTFPPKQHAQVMNGCQRDSTQVSQVGSSTWRLHRETLRSR